MRVCSCRFGGRQRVNSLDIHMCTQQISYRKSICFVILEILQLVRIANDGAGVRGAHLCIYVRLRASVFGGGSIHQCVPVSACAGMRGGVGRLRWCGLGGEVGAGATLSRTGKAGKQGCTTTSDAECARIFVCGQVGKWVGG